MANCTKCGTAVPEGASACPSCGQAVASAAPAASAPSSGGMAPNIAGALAYFPIIAIIWLVMEPYNKDRFIRFHSFQSLALAVCSIGLSIVLVVTIIGIFVMPLVQLGWFVVAVIGAIKAYNNDKLTLPLIGPWSAKQAG